MPCNRSPHNPARKAGSTGTPPATEAPNSIWQPLLRASCRRSEPWRAISCLFGAATGLRAPNQLLVPRAPRLTRSQRAAPNLLRWVEAADQLDHDVDVRFQHRLDI